MQGSTHLIAGVLAAAVVPYAGMTALAEQTIVTTAGFVVGSLLPDIDSPTSILGRYVPFLSKILKHRTLTHSIWFAALTWFLHPTVALGCLLHMLLDAMNPMGVDLFWPIKRKFRVPLIHKMCPSGGVLDNILGFLMFAGCAYFYWKLLVGI